MGYSGAGGEHFMKKTSRKKSRDIVPLINIQIIRFYISGKYADKKYSGCE
jgi:hypothetical protein